MDIYNKIENKTVKVAVIGLGYVGLPLALTFSKKFYVIGYDRDANKIRQLNSGISPIKDITVEVLREYLGINFIPTNDVQQLVDSDFIIICVPTPLTIEKEPDMSYIRSASEMISKILRKGQFIVLESSTYPGTTEEIVIPILEKTGLKAGKDFGVAYSPERVDPGSKYCIEQIPKIVGGINDICTDIAIKLYESVIDAGIIKVKDCKTAEAAKMFENIFRNVNIALVNEFSLICEKMDINVWSVIDAAASKPFGFMPFYPGPGVGGHCIPLDPYYMSYKAKKYDFIPRFIELSGEINNFMELHVVNIAEESLLKVGLRMNGSNIAVLGLAYKKDIDDIRESPAIKIIEEILNTGGQIKVYDPYVKSIKTTFGTLFSEKNIDHTLKNMDCAIFITDHKEFEEKRLDDLLKFMKHPVIIDCRNIYHESSNKELIYRGIGKNSI